MTTSAPAKQPVINGPGQPPVQPGLVKEFSRILSQLSKDEGCQSITNLISEMETLKAENEELKKKAADVKTVRTEIFAAVQKVQNENQDMKGQCARKDAERGKAQQQALESQQKLQNAQKRITDLEMELETNKQEIDKAMVRIDHKEAQRRGLEETSEKHRQSAIKAELELKTAQGERDKTKQEYDTARQELASYGKLAIPLKIVTEKESQALIGMLGTLFDEAHRLAHDFFGQSMLEPQAMRGKSWEHFTKHRSLAGIPLPLSNSDAARQMRTAAVLRLMSEAACEYIFQPVYLAENGTEVAEILSQVSSSHAQWIRRVLLSTDREGQAFNGTKRASAAAEDIIELVGSLIFSPDDNQAFDTAVHKWYGKACKVWMIIQQLERRFEAQYEPHFDSQGSFACKPLPDLLHKDTSSAEGAPSAAKSASEHKARLVMEDIAAEVWPEFIATNREKRVMRVLSGYVLTRAQTAVAGQEVTSLERASSRHVAPGKQRTGRLVMNGPNASMEKLSFLCQRD